MTGELWASDTIRRKLLVVVCLLFCSAQAGYADFLPSFLPCGTTTDSSLFHRQDLFLLVHWSATQNRSEADLTMPTVVSALHPLSIAFLSALVQSFLLERSIRVRTPLFSLLPPLLGTDCRSRHSYCVRDEPNSPPSLSFLFSYSANSRLPSPPLSSPSSVSSVPHKQQPPTTDGTVSSSLYISLLSPFFFRQLADPLPSRRPSSRAVPSSTSE